MSRILISWRRSCRDYMHLTIVFHNFKISSVPSRSVHLHPYLTRVDALIIFYSYKLTFYFNIRKCRAKKIREYRSLTSLRIDPLARCERSIRRFERGPLLPECRDYNFPILWMQLSSGEREEGKKTRISVKIYQIRTYSLCLYSSHSEV